MDPILIVIAVVAGLGLWLVLIYNSLVRLRNEADAAFSGIDVQMKRRADLVPNLIETVKGYAAHEAGTLEAVTRARTAALEARSHKDMEQADSMMEQALGGIFGLAEAYPDLKASQNFSALQDELADTEDKVAAARRYYNAVVQRLNSKIESIPSNFVAKAGGFTEREFFRIENESERAVVRTNF